MENFIREKDIPLFETHFSDWLSFRLPVVWIRERDSRTAHSNFRPEREKNFGNEQSGEQTLTATLS